MTTSLFGVGAAVSVNVNGTLVPQSFIGTGGQTLFNITNFSYIPGTNSLLVFINGQRQISGRDFTESSTTSFTLIEGVIAGDFVDIIGFPETDLTAVTAGSVNYSYPGSNVIRTLQIKEQDYINVKDCGAVGDGIIDDTAAIQLADSLACNGTLWIDGNSVASQKTVYFPAGNYRTTGLVYHGAPWIGDGPTNTRITLYSSFNACIYAVGTNAARIILKISDLMLDGQFATSTAHGIRLGWNQRSFNALDNVQIRNFPGPGLYFKQDCWCMSFRDVYLAFCARTSGGSGIFVDTGGGAVVNLLGFDWFNLTLENNGFIGSGVGGGMTLLAPCQAWKFFGGTWEGNYGSAEAVLTDVSGVLLQGVYLESDPGSIINCLLINGSTIASLDVPYVGANGPITANGLVVANTANVALNQPRSNDRWTNDLVISDTAVVNLFGEGLELLTISIGATARFLRSIGKRIALTDAATILVDSSLGTSFTVTVTAARAFGAPTNPSIGQRISYTVIQGGAGGFAITFNAVYKVTWSNTGNTTGKQSTIEFEYNGTNWIQMSAQSPYN